MDSAKVSPRPYALIPMFDLRHMLDSKSDMQEQLWMEHSPHSLADGESARRDYDLLQREAGLRMEENTPFQLGDERIVQDFGKEHPDFFRYNMINEVRYPEGFQDINTGEPMDIAFRLLKAWSGGTGTTGRRRRGRKSRFGTSYGGFGIPRAKRGRGDLSRIHSMGLANKYLSGREKALVEHGPITHYHGTYAMDEVFGEGKGLKARPMAEHRAVETPEELQGKSLVFTTTNWDEANDWAQQRGKVMGVDPGNVGVVGIRGQDLDFMERPDDSKSQFSTVDIHQGDIPQEKLVEFANRPFR